MSVKTLKYIISRKFCSSYQECLAHETNSTKFKSIYLFMEAMSPEIKS